MTPHAPRAAVPWPLRRRPSPVLTGGLYGSQLGDNLVRAAAAEFVGTFLLVLVGTAVAVTSSLGRNPTGGLAVSLAFGLALAALATSLGHISGCHLNPAVTLALTATRRFPLVYVPAYLLAQLAGAVLAALTVWGGIGEAARSTAHLGSPTPAAGTSGWQAALVEAVITFLLMLVVMAVATDDRVPAAAAGLAAGLALFAAVAVGGPITGGAVNPARALGPMLVDGRFPMLGVYLLAPVAGALAAACVYGSFLARGEKPAV